MQSSLEQLRKYFRLEHENGYANTAVIGGLANVLGFWEGEARKDNLPEDIIQATSGTLRNYAALTPESRTDALGIPLETDPGPGPGCQPGKKARPIPGFSGAAGAFCRSGT